MTGANSATGLRSLPARYLVCDEVDAFPSDAGGEGDPVALAIQRTATFRGRRKILLISTPTDAGASRIEKAFLESDQRRFFVPCRHCGHFQVIRWSGITWPEGDPAKAFYACEDCGGVIEEHDKLAMLAAGEWRATADGDGRTAGFHLPGLLSPFETWGEIATEHEAVHGDPLRMRVWVNTKLGEPYEDRETQPLEPAWFMERLEDFSELLPEKIACITAGIDVPARGPCGLHRLWRASHAIGLQIRSGARRPLSMGGQGRERLGRADLASPASQARPAHLRALRHRSRLRQGARHHAAPADRGRPRLVPFPHGRDVDFFQILTSERLIRTYQRGVALRKWIKPRSAPNEALDCRVYATAALAGLVARGFRLEAEAKRLADMPPWDADKPKAQRRTVIKSGWMER